MLRIDLAENATPAYSLLHGEQILSLLSWSTGTDLINKPSVESLLSERLEKELQGLINVSTSLTPLLAKLRPETKAVMIRHPYIAGHLKSHFRMSQHQLALCLAELTLSITRSGAEPLSCAQDARSTGDEWSHLSSIVDTFPFQCSTREEKFLPLLEEGKPFTSSLSPAATFESALKVSAAVSCLKSTSELAHKFVSTFLWCLALRRDHHKGEKFASRSFNAMPGLALLSNPHNVRTSEFDIEEAILHEAVHAFLFFAEWPHERLLADGANDLQQVTSPWTGATLDLHTGIHALLVWWSLDKYWRIARKSSADPSRCKFATGRIDFIRRGFRSHAFTPFFKTIRLNISAGMIQAIEECSAH